MNPTDEALVERVKKAMWRVARGPLVGASDGGTYTVAQLDDRLMGELARAALEALPAAEGVGVGVALAKIDEARKSVWNSYRHLAARDVALMNDAYDLVAALLPASGAVASGGVEAEREACAKLCETLGEADPDKEDHCSDYLAGFATGYEAAATQFAAAIRARGQ